MQIWLIWSISNSLTKKVIRSLNPSLTHGRSLATRCGGMSDCWCTLSYHLLSILFICYIQIVHQFYFGWRKTCSYIHQLSLYVLSFHHMCTQWGEVNIGHVLCNVIVIHAWWCHLLFVNLLYQGMQFIQRETIA